MMGAPIRNPSELMTVLRAARWRDDARCPWLQNAVERLVEFLDRASIHPVRVGEHEQTAFSAGLTATTDAVSVG